MLKASFTSKSEVTTPKSSLEVGRKPDKGSKAPSTLQAALLRGKPHVSASSLDWRLSKIKAFFTQLDHFLELEREQAFSILLYKKRQGKGSLRIKTVVDDSTPEDWALHSQAHPYHRSWSDYQIEVLDTLEQTRLSIIYDICLVAGRLRSHLSTYEL